MFSPWHHCLTSGCSNALFRAGITLRVGVEKATKVSRDTAITKGMPRGVHSNIIPSTAFSLAPLMSWEFSASQIPSFNALASVRVILRVEKTRVPSAPGTLQLQMACQWDYGTAMTLFPPHFSLAQP